MDTLLTEQFLDLAPDELEIIFEDKVFPESMSGAGEKLNNEPACLVGFEGAGVAGGNNGKADGLMTRQTFFVGS